MRKLARSWTLAALAVLAGGEVLRAQAPAALCAVVQLQISQQATFEREAFAAKLVVANNVVNAPLTNLQVTISFTDPNGVKADSLFFVKITTLTGTNAVDGTGVVQSSSSAEIDWIIIPSTGAGGTNPAGVKYGVTATINAVSAGAPQNVTTFPAPITVNPQPSLKLEYVLPYEVFAQEPLLLPQITPVIPFPLGVRVTNVGYGTAHNFQIQSAQPQITDNKQGLAVDFKLLGTVISGKSVPNTLLVPFGDLVPNQVSLAEWSMTSTLSGRFVSFTSTFTHAADLGGQLTSLLQSVTTYTLIRDVLVDLPGRDSVPDFLVNESMDRGAMQAVLDVGNAPPAEFILESDQPVPVPVTEVPIFSSGTLSGANTQLTIGLGLPASPNTWIHGSAAFPFGDQQIVSAVRSDGKILNPRNAWISKHFRKADLTYLYRVNILDLSSTATTYVLTFSTGSLDIPPGAVKDLAAATGGSGALALSWTAPGDDGYAVDLFGAKYLFQSSIDPATLFVPANAQVSFTTSTPAGSAQHFALSSLIGNATNYVALWTLDTGGQISGISNLTSGYALPNPPTSLVFSSVTAVSASLKWAAGNNSLPVTYAVAASTGPGGAFVASIPYQSAFTSTATITGLRAGTTYFFYGLAQNPLTGVVSPPSLIGSTVTPQGDVLPPRTVLAVSSPQWTAGGTLYVTGRTSLTLTSFDDALSTTDALGLGTSQQFLLVDGVARSTFTNAAPGVGRVFVSTFTLADADGLHYLAYDGVDVVGNREAIHIATAAVDNRPPVSTMTFGSPSYLAGGAVYVATTTPVALSALDPPVVAAGTTTVVAGSGVSRIDVAVDTGVFSAYASTLTFAEGRHVVVFRAIDNLGNIESTHTVTILADATPPVSSVAIGQPQAVLSSGTVLVGARTPLVLSSTDPVVAGVASGVRQVFYQVNGGAFAAYVSTITLAAPDTSYTLGFYAQDNVSNVEVVKSTTVLLDSTPPSVAILSPGGPGVESVVSGAFPVIGSVSDLHLSSWRLEAAPGAYASAGFALISSGTVAVSSAPLGTWSTAGLSGWQTLRLTAVDLVLNTTVVSENVFVGNPVVALVFDGRGTLKKPFDAFEDAAGKVYVADANHDRIAVFTSTGGFAGSYGSRRGDDEDRHGSGLSFDKPKAAAVDAAGNVYVADTNDNRVVKLSPAGSVLLTIPAQLRGDDEHGDQRPRPGQLNHPQGIALDAAGNIYVADTDNHRLQKFSPSGAFALAINLPAAPVWRGDDDEREDDSNLGRPVGIALDGAGSIYTADAGGNRVLKFDPTGALAQTIGSGLLNGPLGVAVSASGDVVIVSDSGNNRVLKLDRLGDVNQVYAPAGSARQGGEDHGDDWRAARSTAALNVPAGLWLDAGGALFLADRNNDRVLELSGPNAPPPPPPPAPPSTAAVVVSTADAQPPRTTLSAASPQWSMGGILYATRQTTFTLSSLDDAVSTGDAAGVGTSAQYLSVDGVARSTFTNARPAPGQVFASSFTLSDADGPRLVGYYGVDAAGNREAVRVSTVVLDDAAPVSSMTVGAPSYVVQGVVFAATSTPVALSAADPPVGTGAAAGSGLARLEVAVDTTAFSAYGSSLAFTPGAHTLLFRAVDNLGNVEATHTVRLIVSSGPLVAFSTACATTRVTKREGGKVERWDRAAVVLSSGALTADLDITVSTPIARSDLEERVKTRKRAEASLVAISTGVEYLPEGTTFAAPVTLVLPYDPAPLAALGVNENDLRAYYWNRATERWDLMPGAVDLASHVVNAQTLHFSLYQVMGPGQGGGGPQPADAASQPFAFGQIYAYPNPSRPGQSPTIHVEAGSADHVEVHVYDLSGRLKESTSADGLQGTFEFRWDVSGVGSGVYIYVVTATKTGAGTIRRTGRLGVIK